ncbi:UDP-Glycosyltransferase superfamily protein [Actinidia rufa]|uniref:UDP-Glycosyltransferase superfamily protein n=1 Tax=Actinidia rufa TaxID=165716 RepID=A0A7J0ECK3_9ERIC|nr:UDP-Glycosyltransferase superfamily protein [Actinidia rufa]
MENHKRETPLKPRRLLLFPIPLQGHITPMLQLANILHATGAFSSITIIHTRFNSPTTAKHPHFTFLPIPDGLSETEAGKEDVIQLLTLINKNCTGPFRDCLAELLATVAEEEGVACLITDALWHFSQALADGFGLPRIVLRTSSVASFVAFTAFPLLREKGLLPKQDSRLEEPVLELPPLKVKDLPTIITHNSEDLYNSLVAEMVKATKSSAGLIWNSFEDLEHSCLAKSRKEFPVPNFPIGPFHKYFPASSSSLLAHDTSSVSWLDTQPPKSVIYPSPPSPQSIPASTPPPPPTTPISPLSPSPTAYRKMKLAQTISSPFSLSSTETVPGRSETCGVVGSSHEGGGCCLLDHGCFVALTQAVVDNFGMPRIVLRTGSVSSSVAFTTFLSFSEHLSVFYLYL